MYVFIDRDSNRVVSISKKDMDIDGLEKFVVSDFFDFSKAVMDDEGNTVKVDYALTAEEFLQRYESSYQDKRVSQYPPIEQQLDMIYWDTLNGTSNWVDLITEIKSNNPKP